MPETVDLRCDDNPRRLLGKLLVTEPRRVDPGSNLLEFACRDCSRDARRDGQGQVRVLHRFDLAGRLVETVLDQPGQG